MPDPKEVDGKFAGEIRLHAELESRLKKVPASRRGSAMPSPSILPG